MPLTTLFGLRRCFFYLQAVKSLLRAFTVDFWPLLNASVDVPATRAGCFRASLRFGPFGTALRAPFRPLTQLRGVGLRPRLRSQLWGKGLFPPNPLYLFSVPGRRIPLT